MYETARVARRKIKNRDFLSDILTLIDSVTGISSTKKKNLLWPGSLKVVIHV